MHGPKKRGPKPKSLATKVELFDSCLLPTHETDSLSYHFDGDDFLNNMSTCVKKYFDIHSANRVLRSFHVQIKYPNVLFSLISSSRVIHRKLAPIAEPQPPARLHHAPPHQVPAELPPLHPPHNIIHKQLPHLQQLRPLRNSILSQLPTN